MYMYSTNENLVPDCAPKLCFKNPRCLINDRIRASQIDPPKKNDNNDNYNDIAIFLFFLFA